MTGERYSSSNAYARQFAEPLGASAPFSVVLRGFVLLPLDAVPRLTRALGVLEPVLDIVEHRVTDIARPGWCERRGWGEFLLSLSDATVLRCEAGGLYDGLQRVPDVPAELWELAKAVRHATALPRIASTPTALRARSLDSIRTRKRQQLAALIGALGPMAAKAQRVVDVGAGRGAFSRLAVEHFRRETMGIERSRDHVAAAVAHVERQADAYSATKPAFQTRDACRDGLNLCLGDLAVGLHACGELGDELVRRAAQSGCDAALISCCLQKISKPRRTPLSDAARGVSFSRGVLGLTNQTAQSMGVEGTLAEILSARSVCYALFLLLRARGIELEPGAAMSGINRRRAAHGLRAVAGQALTLRGLAAASEREIAHYAAVSEAHCRILRRLSLPRAALARLVEVTITLDRAAHFEEQGFRTVTGVIFDTSISPRNLAVFASRDETVLPARGSGSQDESVVGDGPAC